ncbi:MAG: hypothetical protein AB1553_09545 [Nitrospirota bacterium]
MRENAVFIALGFLFLMAGAVPDRAAAEVNVNVDIGVPAPVVIARPPEVVVIPSTSVYYVPDVGIDLFFYSDRWYRRHKGHWYRASYYDGPWVYVPPKRVPAAFVRLPKDYRKVAYHQHRIPYGQLKKEWKEEKRHHKEKEKRHKHGKEHHRDDD